MFPINVDINKILEVALKYRIQLTFLGVLVLMLFSFHVGKNSVEIPAKETVCKEYTDLIGQYREDLTACVDECDGRINDAIDAERKTCELRIINAVQMKEQQMAITNCKVAKALARQCGCKTCK